VWAIRHFQHYLGLQPFTLVTDHSALKWLQTSKPPTTGRRARWMMDLQQYDFKIIHRPGKANANADALSRHPNEAEIEIYMANLTCESNIESDKSSCTGSEISETNLMPWPCCGAIICECEPELIY